MTYKEKRIASADVTTMLNEYLEEHHSVTIEADSHGIRVRVWVIEQGNRKPVAYAYRKCLGDAFNDIDKELNQAVSISKASQL